MKQTFLLLSVLIMLIYLVGCNNTEVEEVLQYDANEEITAADTSSTGVYQEVVEETEETTLQDAMKADAITEEVSENGMSFCDCVKKQKELSDLMLDTEDDDVFDKAMKDLEAMKDGDCKILFASKQNTIEGKLAHERKVKKCLNQR